MYESLSIVSKTANVGPQRFAVSVSEGQKKQNSNSNNKKLPRSVQKRYRSVVIESMIKLSVNFGISAIAIVAFYQIWPQYRSVQSKLRDIQVEVNRTERRVNQARSQFNHNFDASQTRNIMLEQSHLSDPLQRRIVIVEPNYNEQ